VSAHPTPPASRSIGPTIGQNAVTLPASSYHQNRLRWSRRWARCAGLPLNHLAKWGLTYLLAVTLVGDPDPAEVTGTMSGTRVVIADDDVLLREGLASLLGKASFEVIGQAGTGTELLGLVRRHLPDLAIVDIRMPPTYSTEGLEAAQAIRQERPETAILVLSAHVEVEHAMQLLASGHRVGYLLKSRVTNVDEFIDTLERVAKGGSVVDPALVQELFGARRRRDPLTALTDREREVLSLIAEGRSNAGVARRLWVTEGTVEKHVRSVLTKLDLPETDDDHRRVLAVLTYLEGR
jgi:DNA-binding NarL/FixJ family response regulator